MDPKKYDDIDAAYIRLEAMQRFHHEQLARAKRQKTIDELKAAVGAE